MEEKKIEKIFSSVLKKIKPSEEEAKKSFEAANALIRKLERIVPPAVEISLGGSLAKGTNLSGKNEFDIFILFPKHYSHHEMVMLGMSYARRAFHGMKTEVRYAEHPYLQVFSEEYRADIVPAYKISRIDERGSSVDRSQLHTQYVNAKLGAREKDDVRLLKQFMKNFGIYGAEVRVEGFSGYLCELLIIHYGSLLELMKNAAEWRKPAIDIANHHRGADLRRIFDSPLIVVDPTDPARNVAAVVAQTSLSRFIFECMRFLKEPSEKFFFQKKIIRSAHEIRKMMRKRGTRCIAVSFSAPPIVPDVLWPQLKKTAQAIARHIQALDFSVFGCYHWSDGKECVILFEFDRWFLPPIRKAVGPSLELAKNVEPFVAEHKGAFNMHIEHDRIVVVEKRNDTDVKKVLKYMCRKKAGIGIPENMQKAMKKFIIIEGNEIIKGKYLEFLSDYFFAKVA